MDINEILNLNGAKAIEELKNKTISVRSWDKLRKEYDTKYHPVMTDKSYKDKFNKKTGQIERMTRYTMDLQKLAVKRMTELMFAIPVKRVYSPKNDNEKRVARIIEAVFRKNRINAVNIERGRSLFASCENVTIWYSQELATDYAGERSPLRLRCKNFAPMNGDAIYPLFDEYDDLVALSVEYTRTEGEKTVTYFDTYTNEWHIRWRNDGSHVEEETREAIGIEKIAGVYLYRDTPIWEDRSENVYEAEWTISRNGNYIRKNARPLWAVFSDNNVNHGKSAENANSSLDVVQYGQNDKAGYVTWQQATESIKFQVDVIYRDFFRSLQLPDMSMENMKTTPMSGEARKMMFIDAQLKVADESGRWLEFFDREVNVVRAFLKKMYPKLSEAIESLAVDIEITPYTISDETERIDNLVRATGGAPIMSKRTAVANLGWVDDVDKELADIANEQVLKEPMTSVLDAQ